MKKRSVIITVISVIIILIILLLILLKVKKPASTVSHEHSYETQWSYDENSHWYKANCGHESEVSEKSAHTFTQWQITTEATEDAEGEQERFCSVCKYKEKGVIEKLEKKVEEIKTELKPVEEKKVESAKAPEEKKPVEQPVEKPVVQLEETEEEEHEHTFTYKWSKNEKYHWREATCEHTDELKDYEHHTFGAYRPNNDGTIDKDGTKTRKCIHCGYSETVVAPGSKLPFAYYNEKRIDNVSQELNNCTYIVKDFSAENVRVDEKYYNNGNSKVFNIVNLKNLITLQKGDIVFVQGTVQLPKSIKARNSFITSNSLNYGNAFAGLWNENGLGTSLTYRNFYIAPNNETLKQFILVFDQFTDGKGTPELTADLSDFDIVIIKKENIDKVFKLLYSNSGTYSLKKANATTYNTDKIVINGDADLAAKTNLMVLMNFNEGVDLGKTIQFNINSEVTTLNNNSVGWKKPGYGVLYEPFTIGTVVELNRKCSKKQASLKIEFFQASNNTGTLNSVDINSFEVRYIPEF